MKTQIDLNADAGESFGRWRLGADEQLLPLVSSVNVACGWHAGDPATMRRSVELARSCGVALGAHPGLPDLAGFGRRSMALSPADVADACLYQLGALRAFADSAGVALTHVKPHGAFYGLTIREPESADAFTDAVRSVDPALTVVLLAGPTAERAIERGHRVAREAFADLDYNADGTIIIEPEPRAKDPARCVDRVLGILDGVVSSVDGTEVAVDADTICLHGDRPNAVEIAGEIRRALAAAGVTVAPAGDVLDGR